MMRVLGLSLLAMLIAQSASVTWGQTRGFRGSGGGTGRIANAGLELGMDVPEVSVLDENGKDFSLKSLRGKYVVLVFGCLT